MVEAVSRISNFSSIFVHPGGTINLTCNIEASQQTDFVYWYKNKETIQFDNLKLRHSTIDSNNNNNNGYNRKSNKLPKPSPVVYIEPDWQQLNEDEHDSEPAKNDTAQGKRKLDEDELEETTVRYYRSSSTLIIERASSNDTANYTCLVSLP